MLTRARSCVLKQAATETDLLVELAMAVWTRTVFLPDSEVVAMVVPMVGLLCASQVRGSVYARLKALTSTDAEPALP